MVRVARLPLQVGGHLLGLLTTAPDCLVADRQMSERMASDARKREQFQRLKEQFVKDQEVGGVGGGWDGGARARGVSFTSGASRGVLQRRRAARQEELDEDFSYARELRDRERRLRALEEQLERKARWAAGGAVPRRVSLPGRRGWFDLCDGRLPFVSILAPFRCLLRQEE